MLKNTIFQYLCELEKLGDSQLTYIWKSQFSPFHELWKLGNSVYNNTEKFKFLICLWIDKKLEVQRKTKIQNSYILKKLWKSYVLI